MRSDIERRDVAWDPATSTLTVGDCSTIVTFAPGDNEALLRSYIRVVSSQRAVPIGYGALRRDDVTVLAELLDLEDTELTDRLIRLLRLSEAEAVELHSLLRKAAAAAMGIGLLAAPFAGVGVAAEGGAPVASVADKSLQPLPAPVPDAPVDVEVDDAPAPEMEVRLGPATVYERPAPDGDPETDIGDSFTIER